MRVLVSVLACTLAALGCGGDSEAGYCDDGKLIDLSLVKPAEPFDYAALRNTWMNRVPGAPDFVHTGVPCSGATDPAACQATLDRPVDETPSAALGCGMVGCTYLVMTRGDVVEHYITREDVLRFLGPIDAAEDVRLLLLGDYETQCDNTNVSGNSSGFRVSTLRTTGSCPWDWDRVVLQVNEAGDVAEIASESLPRPGETPCP